eukprot:g7640.t1
MRTIYQVFTRKVLNSRNSHLYRYLRTQPIVVSTFTMPWKHVFIKVQTVQSAPYLTRISIQTSARHAANHTDRRSNVFYWKQ